MINTHFMQSKLKQSYEFAINNSSNNKPCHLFILTLTCSHIEDKRMSELGTEQFVCVLTPRAITLQNESKLKLSYIIIITNINIISVREFFIGKKYAMLSFHCCYFARSF
jgi:hypothetical protein